MMSEVTRPKPFLGTGIYTFGEAAQLLHVSTSQVRGWAEGYVCYLDGELTRGEPILQGRAHCTGALTFQDLVELCFVREFRKAGVRLHHIRAAAKLLGQKLNTPYPFATNRLETDGVQILRDAGGQYENVANLQQVFRFAEQFFKNIDFEEDLAIKWWPLGREKQVVIDPHRSFGAPIDLKSGVRTDVIYSTYKAELRDVDVVAGWYEITPESVMSAVEFEEQWRKAA